MMVDGRRRDAIFGPIGEVLPPQTYSHLHWNECAPLLLIEANGFRARLVRSHLEVVDMSFEPYLRASDDGTYELLVPWAGGVHVLPYCFHTEEDATRWLGTPKGRDQIRQLRSRYKPKARIRDRFAPQERAVTA